MRNKISKKSRIIITLGGMLLILSTLGFVALNDNDFKIAKSLDIFYTLFRELNYYYVDDTDPEKLINSGIQGMLESLDPYTTFIPESDMDDFRFMTTGEYGGIGAIIRKAGDYCMVAEPYKGFPAYKAGLIASDTILSINGISTRNKDVSEVSDLLKGTPGTSLTLKIKRFGYSEILEKNLIRENITIKNVPYSGMLNNQTGYIRLANFTKGAGNEVKESLKSLKSQNAESIILDLRGNPGGLLVEAVNVVNIFVPKGQEVVTTKGKVKQWVNRYETTENPVDTEIKLVVLTDRGSASASEIVAGALQDLDRAVIVGQKTFGKGLVQTTRPLSYNTQLKVTTAKYYIPSGRCIQAVDYSHRNEDGSVGYIPDSLISEFRTKNGRSVFDGGGISPDIAINSPSVSNIAISLYSKNLIFDYATIYSSKHDSIQHFENYKMSDEDYLDFVKFVSDKDFDYNTKSDDQLNELIKIAKQENYFDLAKTEFEALKEKLAHDKNKDLQTFKNEIKDLVAEEIVSRYYFQEGRARMGLAEDSQVTKALEVLNDYNKYVSILNTPIDQQKLVKAN